MITVVSNSLIPYYKESFSLDYKTAMYFPMAFFITRVVISLPTSFIMERVGYRKTLKFHLSWCFLGCIAMSALVTTEVLWLTLLGIFLMASGISAIQVVCSPYVSLLSTPDQSIRRQSIATASNSVGTIIAPLLLTIAITVYGYLGFDRTSQQISGLFLCISLIFLAQLVYVNRIELPDIKPHKRSAFLSGLKGLIQCSRFNRLALVLFLYVGTEVCFGTITITYLADEAYGDLGLVRATQLISVYWALMFLGRFLFARYSQTVNAQVVFFVMCSLALVTSLVAIFATNVTTGYLMLAIGLYNSTLYPIVYAQALQAAGQYSAQGAAILIMCSIGGAILPLIQATQIDKFDLSFSYWVPAVSYAVMMILFWSCRERKA